ncbi:TPA_asm: glutathione-regulated potassium-efflux system ancillary protein KefG, partial [Salmonella enterica subsp. enterica serovar Derby]|nr:glutathione-regulated potassium-efflux system ancillary protein KefG [Salmonella enterica subsp. enterica serovar Derby]
MACIDPKQPGGGLMSQPAKVLLLYAHPESQD